MAIMLRRQDSPGAMEPFSSIDLFNPFAMMRDLMRWDPMDVFAPRGVGLSPRFDVLERDDAFVIEADVPGLREQDIEITCTGNSMTISGARQVEREEERGVYRLSERRKGSFSRTFTLPGDVKLDDVTADLDNGVLRVTIPKGEGSRARKIPISKPAEARAA